MNEVVLEGTDYVSPDGTIMCGICGLPKQTEPMETRDGVEIRFPILHNHQLDGLVRHIETDEERADRIKRNRAYAFRGEFAEEGERDRFDRAASDTDYAALQECKGFVSRFEKNKVAKTGAGLILYGHVGRGKTFLAGCIANELVDAGHRVLMTSVRRIRSDIERTYGGQNAVIEGLCKNDLVVLDDFFRERDTETGREITFTVVDALYMMRVPFIVTTNLSKDSLTFPNEKDAPIIERLKERGVRVEVTGPNRRQVKAA